MKLLYKATAHQGKRPYQEDSHKVFGINNLSGVSFVVADGMGGHAAGDLASQTLVKEFEKIFANKDLNGADAVLLEDSLESGNRAISNIVQKDSSLEGMGSTYVAGFCIGGYLYYISVGDSPMYLIRDNTIKQINQDHSLAPVLKQKVLEGRITQQEADTHPNKNALLSSVTGEDIAEVDFQKDGFKLHKNDVIIVASDGVQTLKEVEILNIVQNWIDKGANEVLSDILVEAVMSKNNPKQDNTTVVTIAFLDKAMVQVKKPQNSSQAATKQDDNPNQNSGSKSKLMILIVVVLVLVAVGGYFALQNQNNTVDTVETIKEQDKPAVEKVVTPIAPEVKQEDIVEPKPAEETSKSVEPKTKNQIEEQTTPQETTKEQKVQPEPQAVEEIQQEEIQKPQTAEQTQENPNE